MVKAQKTRSVTKLMPGELLGEKIYQDYGLTVIPRKIFASNYFHYKGGEHVVFGGPSKHGKTELAFDLLAVVATPELPAYVAVLPCFEDRKSTRLNSSHQIISYAFFCL